MASRPIQVTIVNDPLKSPDCEASCGTDWSSLQVLDVTRRQVTEKYGDRIHLTYLDITGHDAGKEMQDWIETMQKQNAVLPLLVVNGQVRISGNFDIRQVMDVIEVEMEMGVE